MFFILNEIFKPPRYPLLKELVSFTVEYVTLCGKCVFKIFLHVNMTFLTQYTVLILQETSAIVISFQIGKLFIFNMPLNWAERNAEYFMTN